MVSTTGEQYAYFELDEAHKPIEKGCRMSWRSPFIGSKTVSLLDYGFVHGRAGGSLRAG
jgi:hypothetical protein